MLMLFAVVLSLLLGFAALAVDMGNLYVVRAELQIAATSAAAAGTIDLPDEQAAVAAAIEFAELNMPPAAHGNVLAAADVIAGHWDDDSRTFTAGAAPLNALQVTTRRGDANGNPVSSIFARFFGVTQHNLSADATAVLLPGLPGGLSSTGDISFTGNSSYEGDIASNGSVTIGGSATIDGDISGGDVTVGGTVTGDVSVARRELVLPPVDCTDVSMNNDNGTLPLIQKGNNLVSPLDANRNFSLTGGVAYNLPPGNYYFNDLKIGGQSSLLISGPTTICLTGDLDTSGGDLINSTGDPTNLMILMEGGSAKLNASVDLFLFLYAPNTDVTITGSADIFGAIVGETITAAGSGSIVFDENLIEVFENEFDVPMRSRVAR